MSQQRPFSYLTSFSVELLESVFSQNTREWCLSVSLVNTFMLASRALQGVIVLNIKYLILVPQPITGLKQGKPLSVLGPSIR